MYAAGKIPGSFFKREGRAGEKATLTARMIDRPLRPLFPKGWRRETQLVAIPMSIDHVHPYDILAMNGASAALMVSDIPFPVPVGAVRIGQDAEGNFLVNPDEEWLLESPARPRGRGHRGGHPDGRGGRQRDHRGGDPRRARHRPRRDQEALRGPARAAQEGRQGEGRDRRRRRSTRRSCDEPSRTASATPSTTATQVEDKLERQDATKRSRTEVARGASATSPSRRGRAKARRAAVQLAFDKLEKETIRQPHRRRQEASRRPLAPTRSATSGSRSGSRRARTARRSSPAARRRRSRSPRSAPRVRRCGSTRSGSRPSKRYFHHYNFPPFSVGEAGFMRGPKRRDIGHGALAERALVPVVPVGGGLPLHDPRRLGHPRVERLVVDGLGLRLDARR